MKSKSLRRAFATLLALIVAGGLPSAAGARHRAPTTGLRTISFAQPPPDFTFDAGEGPTRLAALVGRPVVINFWATWCKPCTDELGAFSDLRRAYGDAVELVSISAEPPGVARSFLEARELAWPVVEDPERHIFDAYSVGPIPVTIVLDRSGRVGHVSVGELDWNELDSAVQAAGAPAPAPSPTPLSSPGADQST
jgi:peroxiredoxin